MSATSDSTPEVTSVPTPDRQLVSIYVEQSHPRLQLKQALDWEAITQVMVKHWRAAGKNVDGGPGQPWPVSLSVPLLVLKAHQPWPARQAEQELAENVVARVFVGCQAQLSPPVRDHANIARAEAALGATGMEELNQLLVSTAVRFEFADPNLLSSDTTVQELPIGYPNEPGILRGLARALSAGIGQTAAMRFLRQRGGRKGDCTNQGSAQALSCIIISSPQGKPRRRKCS